jgi:hypothetical protein
MLRVEGDEYADMAQQRSSSRESSTPNGRSHLTRVAPNEQLPLQCSDLLLEGHLLALFPHELLAAILEFCDGGQLVGLSTPPLLIDLQAQASGSLPKAQIIHACRCCVYEHSQAKDVTGSCC